MIQRHAIFRGRAALRSAALPRARRRCAAGAVLPGAALPHVNSDQVLGDTWTWNGASSTWAQACTSCTVTPPPAIGAAIAYHRADVEDLLYGGYSDTGSRRRRPPPGSGPRTGRSG